MRSRIVVVQPSFAAQPKSPRTISERPLGFWLSAASDLSRSTGCETRTYRTVRLVRSWCLQHHLYGVVSMPCPRRDSNRESIEICQYEVLCQPFGHGGERHYASPSDITLRFGLYIRRLIALLPGVASHSGELHAGATYIAFNGVHSQRPNRKSSI